MEHFLVILNVSMSVWEHLERPFKANLITSKVFQCLAFMA